MPLPRVDHSPADLKSLTRDELRAARATRCARRSSMSARAPAATSARGSASSSSRSRCTTCSTRRATSSCGTSGIRAIRTSCSPAAAIRFETLRQEDGHLRLPQARRERVRRVRRGPRGDRDLRRARHRRRARSQGRGLSSVVAVLGDGALTSGLVVRRAEQRRRIGSRHHRRAQRQRDVDRAERRRDVASTSTQIQRNPLYNRAAQQDRRASSTSCPGRCRCSGTVVRKWEESVKTFLTPGVLFEELGFRYFGPIDGHDIDALVDTFTAVQRDDARRGSCTSSRRRARAFPRASIDEKWHALPPGHDPATGKQLQDAAAANPAYTAVFGKGLTELAQRGHVGRRDHRGDAERARARRVRRGDPGALLRRRHRRRARGHVRGGTRDARHQARSSRSTRRSCSARTTTSSTTSRSSSCRWCSAWIARGSSARTARRTWASTTSRTCSRCRG